MLMPKRTKYRKAQRGRMRGIALRGSNIDFGQYSTQHRATYIFGFYRCLAVVQYQNFK